MNSRLFCPRTVPVNVAFRSSATFNERSNDLRDLRAAHILADQPPAQLEPSALPVVAHVVPVRAFDGVLLGMDALNAARDAVHPLWGGADYTWNIDGLLAVGDSSYAQVFTTGVIEYGDTVLFRDGVAHGDQLRGALAEAFTRALRWLSSVGSGPPVNVAVTLLRARNRRFTVGMRQTGTFDRDVIRVPVTAIRSNEPAQVEAAIDDVLDAVSSAAGFMRFR